MNDQRKEDLKAVAEGWAHRTLDTWFTEYQAWDDFFDAGLFDDDWEYITNNFKFTITVEEK